MADVVVTVPMHMWQDWLFEGDLPGEDRVGCPDCLWSGPRGAWIGHLWPGFPDSKCVLAETPLEWEFFLGENAPKIEPGERVYVVAHGRLRGYAPLIRVDFPSYSRRCGLVRGEGGVAVTIDHPIKGFRGWRYRWWDRADERPFPDWKIADVK